jgi:XTP/dITP diphosphohydrolase
VVATSNPGKVREIAEILADAPVELVSLVAFGELPDVVEDGATFMENAIKKALHFARLTGEWTLADDSGLEVDALGGAPGVFSARYAGEPKDDAANNRKLIAELRGVPPERRTSRFRCAAVLADGERILAMAEGTIEGVIIDQPRGANGFGYDPHFFVPALGRTTAELDPAHKNRISHRGQAVTVLLRELRYLLALQQTSRASAPLD